MNISVFYKSCHGVCTTNKSLKWVLLHMTKRTLRITNRWFLRSYHLLIFVLFTSGDIKPAFITITHDDLFYIRSTRELEIPKITKLISKIFICINSGGMWSDLSSIIDWMSPQCTSQIARFMWPIWDPPRSCRPQVGPMFATWTLLSGLLCVCHNTAAWISTWSTHRVLVIKYGDIDLGEHCFRHQSFI